MAIKLSRNPTQNMIKSAICREQCDNYGVHKEVSFIFEAATYPNSYLAFSSPLLIVAYLAKILRNYEIFQDNYLRKQMI